MPLSVSSEYFARLPVWSRNVLTPTPEEIEAVARALWIASALDVMKTGWAAKAWDDPNSPAFLREFDRRDYRRNARAAILALDSHREEKALPEKSASGRSPCCTVSYSGADHFPKGITWYITWLPKGYAPTKEDELVCAVPDKGNWDSFGLREGEHPPLIQAICAAVEKFMIQAAPQKREA